MSRIKENVIMSILDHTQKDPNKVFSLDKIAKISGHTHEITRKWVKYFIRKGILEQVPNRSPFRGRLTKDILKMDVISFFKLYNGKL